MSLGCKANLGNSCCLPGSPPSHLVPPPGTLSLGGPLTSPSKSPGSLSEMQSLKKKKKKKQSLRPHFRSTEPESLGVGSGICAFTSSSGGSNACTIIELLPVRRGKLMPRGRRLKSGNTSSCLRHLWVRWLLIAGGCPYPKYSHMHTHTLAHI